MLQRIRDNASGPIAYLIVGLIALVFGVWGIGSYFTENPNPPVAQAGDVKITKYQLQQTYDQRYRRLQQLMGENFDPDLIDPKRFRRGVLDSLIQEALLRQHARDAGYRVIDRDLLRALGAEERFQVDGRFSPERYHALLSQAGIAAGDFEAGLREDLLVEDLRRALLESSFVTHREVAADYRIDRQRRKAAYLAFRVQDFLDEVTVDDTDIQAYYDANHQDFTRPERVKIAYVEADRDKLEPAAEPREEVLRALYEREKNAHFRTAERRKARQILIRVGGDTDASAARNRIQELDGKLRQGADFAALARQYSDDETAEQGGELGWVTRGDRTAAFEKALFDLEQGKVSAPVKDERGWHLIKLEEIDPAVTKPFKNPEVRAQVLALYRDRERDKRFRQLSERLDSLSFEAPDSLRPISEELGLEIHQSDWITRSDGEGVGDQEAVRKAAFSDSVLKDGLNSTPIQLASDRLVVVRVIEHQAGELRPLSSVHDQIASDLRRKAAADLARKHAEEAMSAAQAGRPLAEIAADGPAELHEPGWVKRDDETLDAPLREALFAMPRPADKAGYSLAALPDGGTALLRLSEVESGGVVVSEPAAEVIARRRALRARIAGLELAAFRQQLEKDYKVEIHEDRLN